MRVIFKITIAITWLWGKNKIDLAEGVGKGGGYHVSSG